jgi:hypothetical protein
MYVLPMVKHELDLVTGTYTMSCNVMLQDCTRHTRTLPILTDLEAGREADLRGLGCFSEAVIRLGNARWVSMH